MSDETQGTFVLPTSIAVHRYQQMKVESILNTEYQVTDERTPLEHCLDGDKDPEKTIGLLGLEGDQADIATDILEDALEGGDLEEIYGPRGGLLAILLPTTSPSIDLVWQAMEIGAEGAPTEAAFVHTPNEIFCGLTPAQIWVGAGKHEMAIADAYLPLLWGEMKEKTFATPGKANTEWLGKFRLWSYNKAQGYNGRVVDVVHQERTENFNKRRALYAKLGIETPFVAKD